MKLTEIIETNEYIKQHKTDKESRHSYCSLFYQKIFENIKNKKMNILEIGIKNGSSLVLWNEFFKNSIIYGIDNSNLINNRLDIYPRIKPIIQDAYNQKILNHLPLFDIIIDDGPHTLESQKKCIDIYFNKLKKGGVIIIEDVDGDENFEKLVSHAQKYSTPIEYCDNRDKTKTNDSLVVVIKNNQDTEYLK